MCKGNLLVGICRHEAEQGTDSIYASQYIKCFPFLVLVLWLLEDRVYQNCCTDVKHAAQRIYEVEQLVSDSILHGIG